MTGIVTISHVRGVKIAPHELWESQPSPDNIGGVQHSYHPKTTHANTASCIIVLQRRLKPAPLQYSFVFICLKYIGVQVIELLIF